MPITPRQRELVSSVAPEIPFEKYTLENGLEVILSEDHRLPIVAVNIWYHVGPANEKPGRTGFAHLFEHMMFQGSKHVGDNQIRVLQAAGATAINGTTGFDRTNYFETMPSDRFELALWLESDRMAFLLDSLTARKLENQRDVVRNERRERENTPYALVSEELYRQLFPAGHPYRASIIGSHEDIESVGLDDVREFCRQYYVPNNASLALVGDFDSRDAKQLIERYFASIPAGAPASKPNVPIPSVASARRVTVTDRVELPCIYKAWVTTPVYEPGDAEADVLANILGGGVSGRLYQRLVYRDQIAQDVSASHQSMMLGSVFLLRATAKPGVALDDLERALDEELALIQSAGPAPEELERIRNGIEAGFVFSLEQPGGMGGVADRLNLYNHYLGDPGYVARDFARFENVTAAGVQSVAGKLTPESSVVVLAVPGPKIVHDVPKRIDAETVSEMDSSPSGNEWRSDPPKAHRRTLAELPVPVSFNLSNGLNVLFLEQHHLPAITANLVILGGAGSNPPRVPGLSSFTAAMLARGTSRRSHRRLADDFGRLGARWAIRSHTDSSTATLHVLRKNADAAFQILSDAVLHPAFDNEEIERVRAQRLVSIAQQRDNPAAVAETELLLQLYGAEHSYGSPGIGTESSNQKIQQEDLLQFYSARWLPQNAALVIVGDLAPEEAQALARTHFSQRTGGTPSSPPPEVRNNAARRIIVVDRPSAPQTHLLVGQIGVTHGHPDYAAIELMNAILGGTFSSRINTNLREVHGYTYGARSGFSYHRSPGPFTIRADVRTDATAAALREIFHEMERLRDAPPSPEELAVVVESFTRSLASRFETLASSAGSVGELFVHDLGLDFFKNLPAAVASVSLGDIHRAARNHLRPESMVVVAVGDANAIERALHELNLGPVSLLDLHPNTESGTSVRV